MLVRMEVCVASGHAHLTELSSLQVVELVQLVKRQEIICHIYLYMNLRCELALGDPEINVEGEGFATTFDDHNLSGPW